MSDKEFIELEKRLLERISGDIGIYIAYVDCDSGDVSDLASYDIRDYINEVKRRYNRT